MYGLSEKEGPEYVIPDEIPTPTTETTHYSRLAMANSELLIRYLEDSLNEEERKDIEQRLTQDPLLREELEETQNMIAVLSNPKRHAKFIQIANEIREEKEGKHRTDKDTRGGRFWGKVIRQFRVPLSMAAAVLLLLGVYFLLRPESPSTAKLFAEYYESLPATDFEAFKPAGTVSASDNLSPAALYNQAVDQYTREDYEGCLNSLTREVRMRFPNESLFIEGIALIGLERHEEAIPILLQRTAPTHSDREYYFAAQWYLALAYLKTGDTESAKQWLNDLGGSTSPKASGPYQEQAKSLLQELGS